MLGLPPSVRIYFATGQVDMRNGINGLRVIVEQVLKRNSNDGHLFVFIGKRRDMLKILFWDGSGLVMACKRLEADSFSWPAIRDGAMTLSRTQFEALFAGLELRRVRPPETPKPAVAE